MRVRRAANGFDTQHLFPSLSFFSLSLSLFLSYPFRRPDRGDGAIVRLETSDDDDLSGLEKGCRYSPPSDSACTILGSALLPSRNSSRVSLSSWFLSIWSKILSTLFCGVFSSSACGCWPWNRTTTQPIRNNLFHSFSRFGRVGYGYFWTEIREIGVWILSKFVARIEKKRVVERGGPKLNK